MADQIREQSRRLARPRKGVEAIVAKRFADVMSTNGQREGVKYEA